MTAHILLNKDLTKDEIINLKNEIKSDLKDEISHITLEIEYLNENCNHKKC